jgi:hypothetical protein
MHKITKIQNRHRNKKTQLELNKNQIIILRN